MIKISRVFSYSLIMAMALLLISSFFVQGNTAEADLRKQIINSVEVTYKTPSILSNFASGEKVAINKEGVALSTSEVRVWQNDAYSVIVELQVDSKDIISDDTSIGVVFKDEDGRAWIVADHPVLSHENTLGVAGINKSYVIIEINEETITPERMNSTIEVTLFKDQLNVGHSEQEALAISFDR